jgi:hypothetical protein
MKKKISFYSTNPPLIALPVRRCVFTIKAIFQRFNSSFRVSFCGYASIKNNVRIEPTSQTSFDIPAPRIQISILNKVVEVRRNAKDIKFLVSFLEPTNSRRS